MNSQKTLWMGDIDSWMGEDYISQIYSHLNIPVKNVRIIKDKVTGIQQGYCFVEFENQADAKLVLDKYNGKQIANSSKNFKLNWAMYNSSRGIPNKGVHPGEVNDAYSLGEVSEENTMFVGDLDPFIKEEHLREIFSNHYPSVTSAKVILDPITKRSKCYGFVKFRSLSEFERALAEMNGFVIFNRAIKVNQASKKAGGERSLYTINNFNSNYPYNNHFNNNSSNFSNNYPNNNNFYPNNQFSHNNFKPQENSRTSNPCSSLPSTSSTSPTLSNSKAQSCNLFNSYNFYIQSNINVSDVKDMSSVSETIEKMANSKLQQTNFNSFANMIPNMNLSNFTSFPPSDKPFSKPQSQISYYYNYLINFTPASQDNLCVQYSKYGHDEPEGN